MGVLVDGVEIPIRVGQTWADCGGNEWEILDVDLIPLGYAVFAHCVKGKLAGFDSLYTREGRYWANKANHNDLIRLLSGPGSEATAPATEAPTQPQALNLQRLRAFMEEIQTGKNSIDQDDVKEAAGEWIEQIDAARAALSDPTAPTQPDVTAELRWLVQEAWEIMKSWPSPKMGNPLREEIADDYRAWRKRAKAALSGEPQAKEGLSNG